MLSLLSSVVFCCISRCCCLEWAALAARLTVPAVRTFPETERHPALPDDTVPYLSGCGFNSWTPIDGFLSSCTSSLSEWAASRLGLQVPIDQVSSSMTMSIESAQQEDPGPSGTVPKCLTKRT